MQSLKMMVTKSQEAIYPYNLTGPDMDPPIPYNPVSGHNPMANLVMIHSLFLSECIIPMLSASGDGEYPTLFSLVCWPPTCKGNLDFSLVF